MDKKIFLIVGRTGSGKDTLVNQIAEKYNMNVLKSYTTRPKRTEEKDTHIFIREEDFEEDFEIYKEQIVAYTEIDGYRYFSTYDQLNKANFYIVDPNGIKTLKGKYNLYNFNFVVIYIYATDTIRNARAIHQRKDRPEIFNSRNQDEDLQFSTFEQLSEYDYIIDNSGAITKSILEFEKILHNEGIENESNN